MVAIRLSQNEINSIYLKYLIISGIGMHSVLSSKIAGLGKWGPYLHDKAAAPQETRNSRTQSFRGLGTSNSASPSLSILGNAPAQSQIYLSLLPALQVSCCLSWPLISSCFHCWWGIPILALHKETMWVIFPMSHLGNLHAQPRKESLAEPAVASQRAKPGRLCQ